LHIAFNCGIIVANEVQSEVKAPMPQSPYQDHSNQDSAAPLSTVDRKPLHQQVSRILRHQILHAQLAPGAKLNESRLAEELDVSRTPLREALLQLQQEGFLTAEPGRGFSVAELSSREVRELFAIIGALEIKALEWGGIPNEQIMMELSEINFRLGTVEDDVDLALSLNAEWHRTLVRGCPNRHLVKMIEEVRAKVYRYEYYYYTEGAARVGTSVELHRDIMQPLARGDLQTACAAVTRHWLTDMDLMLPQMLQDA
jgi:DNA-binding GntR family transcriptional regulator